MEAENTEKVSRFKNYRAKKSVEVDLPEHLMSSQWKEHVEAIRREPDKAKRDRMKRALPAITPSGIFRRHCSSGIISYSGFICIDIDGKDNPCINDWEALKTSISHLPGLWYAGLSVSGNGIFVLFRVKYPERHKEHFAAISADMKNYGIIIDESGKDICRLRGVSYDEHPIFNPDAAKYEKLIVNSNPINVNINEESPIIREECTEIVSQITTQTATQTTAMSATERNARNVRKLVERIERTGADITDDYHDWFAIGRALASEFGEYGRNWYHIVSEQSPKYKPHECDKQYNACLRCCSRTTIRTFFRVCQRFGITFK